jgi:ketosteroid isomerase-like protein
MWPTTTLTLSDQSLLCLTCPASELDGFRFDIQQVLASGDLAVSQLRYRGTVKNTGRSLDVQAAIVWEVRDGKVICTQEYMDTWEFMNAWKAG